jgi:hypothetical protein
MCSDAEATVIYNRVLQLLAFLKMGLCVPAVYGAWFLPLPNLPGSTQGGNAFAISADGSTVVGMSHNGSALQAVRWTISPQPTVGPLGAGDSSIGWGVSADGSVIVAKSRVREVIRSHFVGRSRPVRYCSAISLAPKRRAKLMTCRPTAVSWWE